MLSDITLGQYFPGSSAVHRMDPRTKILVTIAYVVILFVASNWAGFVLSGLFLALIVAISGIPVKSVLRGVKPILPLILFTAILNMFFVGGTEIWRWGFLRLTVEGIGMAITMAVRIVLLIMGTSLLTYTTSPIALTDAIEQLLKPLNKIHFPVHEMAMMMTIALRFIPTLIEETDKIMAAQKARGADLESGNLMQRMKALIPILIPLFISAFRRAEELALAMECRCYQGGEGRTRMRQLHYGKLDGYAFLTTAVCVAAVILCNLWVPSVF